MAEASLKKTYDKITEKLDRMIDRAKSTQAYFARIAYPMYQRAQIERWQTENMSQGDRWKPLKPGYAKYKLRKYAGMDYGGSKILIATGKLLKSVVGPGQGHVAVFKNQFMEIGTLVDYAPDVAEERPFMKFGRETIDDWNKRLRAFILAQDSGS